MSRAEHTLALQANQTAVIEVERLLPRLWKLRQDLQSEIQGLGHHSVSRGGEFLTVRPTAPLSGHPPGSYFVSYGEKGTLRHVTVVFDADGNVIAIKPLDKMTVDHYSVIIETAY